jgi:hypothetical protein
MDYKVVESSEIVWCPSDDRYILIIKEEDAIIGLSYMQGDELELFKEHYCYVDYDLTDFYNAVKDRLRGNSELDRINEAIWAHFEYRNLRDERKYKNNNK